MASLHVKPPLLFTVGAIWPPVCAAVVILRFRTRRAQKVDLGIDDWLVLPALALIWGIGAAILAGTALKSLGYPTPVQDPNAALMAASNQLTVTRKIFWAVGLLHIAALTCIKISCMMFYRRVFRTGVSRTVDNLILLITAIIIAWGVSFFFAFLFFCRTHFNYLWTTLADTETCANAISYNLGVAVSDFITDFIIMVFPIPLIWRLQMSKARKFGVMIVFLFGAIAIAASIVRMVIFSQVVAYLYNPTADPDFISTVGLYFMAIEAGFGLCAICLPTLAGVLKLKGLRSFLNGFQSFFSSLRDNSQDNLFGATDKTYGAESLNSESHLHTTAHGFQPKENSYDLELQSLPSDNRIGGTNSIEQKRECV